MENKNYKAHLALLGANLIYGANFLIAKGLMPNYFKPSGLVLLRVLAAGMLFWIVKQFIKNVGANFTATIVNSIFPLVTIPLLIERMGVSGYGAYVTLVSLTALIIIVTDFGLGMYLPKAISSSIKDDDYLTKLLSGYVQIKLYTAFLLVGFVSVFYEWSSLNLIMFLFVLMQMLNLGPVLSGLQKYESLAIGEVASKLVILLLIILLDFTDYPIHTGIFTLLIGSTFGLLFVTLEEVMLIPTKHLCCSAK